VIPGRSEASSPESRAAGDPQTTSRFRIDTRCASSGMTALSALFPLHGLPADVPAAKAFRPFDAVDGLIGALLRFRHGLAERADVEPAAAIGDDAAVFHGRAGVEDLDAFDLCSLIEPLDHRSLAIVAGIAPGGHDHGERGFVIPAQAEILQLPV